MAAFNSLGHIALKVQDLEASIGFYEKLGFPEFLRLTEEDGQAWIAYLKFDDNLYLEPRWHVAGAGAGSDGHGAPLPDGRRHRGGGAAPRERRYRADASADRQARARSQSIGGSGA